MIPCPICGEECDHLHADPASPSVRADREYQEKNQYYTDWLAAEARADRIHEAAQLEASSAQLHYEARQAAETQTERIRDVANKNFDWATRERDRAEAAEAQAERYREFLKKIEAKAWTQWPADLDARPQYRREFLNLIRRALAVEPEEGHG